MKNKQNEEIDINQLLKDLETSEKDKNDKEKKYKDYYFNIYDNCDHLVVISGDDYDSMEGKHHYHYGCIKCGLNTHACDGYYGSAYDLPYQVMYDYFISRGCFLGYLKKYNFKVNGSYLEGKFVKLCNQYQKLLNSYKNLSNEEIALKITELLKKNNQPSRTRKR